MGTFTAILLTLLVSLQMLAGKVIKGEHVYITQNGWQHLEAMINFTAIPRGALVNKNGKLIENNFEVGQFNSEELKKLAEKF